MGGRGEEGSGAEAARIEAELAALADPERAASYAWFFQTQPGGYGEGDRFLGITMPKLRAVARRHRELDDAGVAALLASPLHEHRLVAAAILRLRYERAAGDAERRSLCALYLRCRAGIDNWDLVDSSAPYVLGSELVRGRRLPTVRRLARARRLWDRRIAIVATMATIRAGEAEPTLEIAAALLGDRHDLIHKGVGWALRELGKRDPGALRGFLDAHAATMPRTMLRYSLERLDPGERRHYMELGRG